MKKNSFIHVLLGRMLLQLLLLVVILVSVLGLSYGTMRDELRQTTRSMLEIYGNNLTYQMSKMENLLRNLVYNNNSLPLLESEDESVRYYAAMDLRQELDNLLMDDAGADLLVMAEREHNISLDIPKEGMELKEKEALRAFTRTLLDDSYGNDWAFMEISGKTYLYQAIRSENWIVAVYLSTENWMNAIGEDVDGLTFLVADSEEKAWAFQGTELSGWETGRNLSELPTKHFLTDSYSLEDGKIVLYSYQDQGNVWRQARMGMVLVVCVILIMVFFMATTVKLVRRQVMAPMDDMVRSMERIKQGDYEARLNKTYRYLEFNLFKDTFNHLMDEIIGLKIASYEKQIVLSETELRCIRLQIRPHFFLNAMTTISSLSMQGKNAEIKKYIDALSKNIRYMFRAGLHTVPLKEEIQHVENYFEMQDLKYPGSVFYFIDLPEELEQWPVPQMLIHTIIENEYKYAVSVENMLTILIRIGTRQVDGEEMLAIDIEDDGSGYPEEVLAYMREETAAHSRTGERVGLRSIKNMLEIMYDRKGLFVISNISPHGCLNQIFVPSEPVHVVEEGEQKERTNASIDCG
ncbi:MAG: histidine kinase [Eubacteriales bacterium]|nr:histidine kinase [Eubacteriales bacterium]